MYKFKSFLSLFFLMSGLLCHAQTEVISFEHVNLIPMNTDTVMMNQRVIVNEGRILKIESASLSPSTKIDFTINASGKYLIPGLVETHYHLQNNIENEFKLLIANGITSVRNMAEYEGQDHIAIREQTRNNQYLSPHYYTTGPYLTRNDLSTVDSVEKVIERHKERGYDFLKIADNLSKEVFLKLLELADKEQIKVIGHGQRKLPLEYSLRMKSIAHLEEFMNIFSKQEMQSEEFLVKAARDIKASGIYISPTLGIFEMIMRYADKEKSNVLNQDENIKYLPIHYADYWKSNKINFRKKQWFTAESSLVRLENELAWQIHFTKILHEQGVPLMAGSDTYGLFLPGFSLHHELELLHSAGLSTYETLKTATVIPARYFNTFSQSGTITEGKLADLVLLEKDPLKDIKNTKAIAGVLIKGKWLDKEKLNKLLLEVENSNK